MYDHWANARRQASELGPLTTHVSDGTVAFPNPKHLNVPKHHPLPANHLSRLNISQLHHFSTAKTKKKKHSENRNEKIAAEEHHPIRVKQCKACLVTRQSLYSKHPPARQSMAPFSKDCLRNKPTTVRVRSTLDTLVPNPTIEDGFVFPATGSKKKQRHGLLHYHVTTYLQHLRFADHPRPSRFSNLTA